MPGQKRDVLPPLAQCRQRHLDGVDPVIQVVPELVPFDPRENVLVRCRQQPHVCLEIPRPAKPLELSVLQHAQQLRLQLRAHLGNLIQQQRSAVGQFKFAGLRRQPPP